MIFLYNFQDLASEEARSSISFTSFEILMHSESIVLTEFFSSGISILDCSGFSAFAKMTARGDFNSCEADAIKSFWLFNIISVGFNAFFISKWLIILLWRLNIDVFTCLNFHLPRWSTLCYGPCLTDVHWTSSTINRCSTRYNSFFRLADENLFCVKFIDI